MANSTRSIHALFSLAERSSMLLSAQNEAEGTSDSMEWALKSSSLRGGFLRATSEVGQRSIAAIDVSATKFVAQKAPALTRSVDALLIRIADCGTLGHGKWWHPFRVDSTPTN